MIFKTFKAEIENYVKESTVPADTLILDSYFSKKCLLKHMNVWNDKNEEWPPNPETRKIHPQYTLTKDINDFGETEYRIKFNPPAPGVSYKLNMDWLNKIKCNAIHGEYLIQKEPLGTLGLLISLGLFIAKLAGK